VFPIFGYSLEHSGRLAGMVGQACRNINTCKYRGCGKCREPHRNARPDATCTFRVHPEGNRGDPLIGQDQGRYPGGGILGKGGQAVAVAIQGDADVRMTQAFGDHLGMHPGDQSQGGVGVPEIMQANPG